MNTKLKLLAAMLLLSTIHYPVSTALAENIAFTYQGQVIANGTPFTGTGEFQFALVLGTPNQPASATAVMGGIAPYAFVNSFQLNSGGSGYRAAPAVTITGGGGAGAAAVANLMGGTVIGLTVINPGSGYTSTPMVTIAPPGVAYVTLWSNDGSSQEGSEPVASVSVAVANGQFTVALGNTNLANMLAIPASLFTQPGLQLRLWFTDGTHGFAALNPPQSVTLTPYAAFAVTAGNATTAGSADSVAATNITGTLPVTELPASVLTNGASGVAITGTFAGNGGGLTNVTAAALATPPGMALVPAGMFTMGDTLDGESDALPTNLTVSAFYLDLNLVTYAQWQSVYFWATNHGYDFDNTGWGKAANYPVEEVAWYDAVKWCNARSQQAGLTPVYTVTVIFGETKIQGLYQTGDSNSINVNWSANGYRLPTEAEWEKAARGGLSGQRFPWGNIITENLANYTGATNDYSYDSGPSGFNAIGSIGGTSPATSPVATFAANGYGLYDLAGNVFEWCWDWYGTPYGQPANTNPTGPATGSYRVLRGGDWCVSASSLRCAYRLDLGPASIGLPGWSPYYMGFRCVRGH